MVFTSPRFFVFILIVLLGITAIPSREWKKRFLMAASCFFYAAWDWRYLGLLLFISVIDYIAASKIAETDHPRIRKAWLVLSVVSNLGVLAYFKYCNFFIDNFNLLLGGGGLHIEALKILLPVGISFYTFKTMSYTIDVYRNEIEPCRKWLDYATFITFFPELVAGPIVRGSVFLPQMNRMIGLEKGRFVVGSSIFVQGLIKKLLIADRVSKVADPVFASPELFHPVTIWFGVLAYTIQIYCDFSGYSDMAIGIAKIIGYDLPENFNMPYWSANITEFWRRWHITLSSWLRDYLYIPLGGNRHGPRQTYLNLMLTMLLGGLWHGASWNFVLWGGLHGGALAIHKFWRSGQTGGSAWGAACAHLGTLMFVVLTWVPFRSQSFQNSILIYKKLFVIGTPEGGRWYPEWLFWCSALLVIGHVIGINVEGIVRLGRPGGKLKKLLDRLGFRVDVLPIAGPYIVPERITVGSVYVMSLLLIALFLFSPFSTNPFIYFQF